MSPLEWTPVNGYLLVKEHPKNEKTESGLILASSPTAQPDLTVVAEVIKIGSNDSEITILVGQSVVFDVRKSIFFEQFSSKDEKFRALKLEDLIAIL